MTAGRHRRIDVINVKHNLFQQIRWSRTIGSNTSHIFLFKSPRDLQQLDLLIRQLNVSNLLRSCYELATRDSFGHLLTDLDPSTLDCWRFCSNITRPGQQFFINPYLKQKLLQSQIKKKYTEKIDDKSSLARLSQAKENQKSGNIQRQLNGKLGEERNSALKPRRLLEAMLTTCKISSQMKMSQN